jgi:hypothetical protein
MRCCDDFFMEIISLRSKDLLIPLLGTYLDCSGRRPIASLIGEAARFRRSCVLMEKGAETYLDYVVYSFLNAWAGSTDAARCAGMIPATHAATASVHTAAVITLASHPATWYSCD